MRKLAIALAAAAVLLAAAPAEAIFTKGFVRIGAFERRRCVTPRGHVRVFYSFELRDESGNYVPAFAYLDGPGGRPYRKGTIGKKNRPPFCRPLPRRKR